MSGFSINKLVVLVFVLCLIISPGRTQTQSPKPYTQKASKSLEDSTHIAKLRKKKSPTGALLRSLVFPGWGQWYNEQKIKAGIAFAAESFLMGLTLHFHNKASKQEPGSSEREFYTDKRDLTFLLLGGVTLLSMLDAYVDAYLFDFDTGPDLALRVGVTSNSKTAKHDPVVVGLALRTHF